MGPYAVIQYKGQERKSSVADGYFYGICARFVYCAGRAGIRNGMRNLCSGYKYPGSGDPYKLILKIMDKDLLSSDGLVGQAIIYVKDLLAQGVEKGGAELHPLKYRVGGAGQSYCDEIEVGVTFTREFEENIAGGRMEGKQVLDAVAVGRHVIQT